MDPSSPTSLQGAASLQAEISPASRCTPWPPDQPPESLRGRKVLKGTHAKFLYENPRFINEPIRYVLPDEGARSVGECMDWSEGKNEMYKRGQSTTNTTSTGDNETWDM